MNKRMVSRRYSAFCHDVLVVNSETVMRSTGAVGQNDLFVIIGTRSPFRPHTTCVRADLLFAYFVIVCLRAQE